MRYPLAGVIALAFAAGAAASTTHTVGPGQSIQAALDRAEEGDRVQVLPGVYGESISVDKNGTTVIGLNDEGSRAVLDGGNELSGAIHVSGADVTIEGFVIRDYVNSGITAQKAKNLRLRDLLVHSTGAYGLRLLECHGLLVEGCVIGQNTEAGIAIEQSMNIKVRNNEVYRNGAGIALVNFLKALVENNSAHHNGVGLFAACLPGLPFKEADHCRVINNRFWSNTAPPLSGTPLSGAPDDGAASTKPGAITTAASLGTGIVILAADHSEVTQNLLEDNGSYGIMVLGLASSGAAGRFKGELDVEPNSDHAYIHHNTYKNNGGQPSETFRRRHPDVPPGDLFWDETGERNQFQESGELKTFPKKLVQKYGGIHTNVIEFY